MAGEKSVLDRAKKCAKALGCAVIRMSFRPGVAVGWSDLLILAPGGRPLFMETKRKGESASDMQQHRHLTLLQLGYKSVIVDTPEDACKAVQDHCKLYKFEMIVGPAYK